MEALLLIIPIERGIPALPPVNSGEVYGRDIKNVLMLANNNNINIPLKIVVDEIEGFLGPSRKH